MIRCIIILQQTRWLLSKSLTVHAKIGFVALMSISINFGIACTWNCLLIKQCYSHCHCFEHLLPSLPSCKIMEQTAQLTSKSPPISLYKTSHLLCDLTSALYNLQPVYHFPHLLKGMRGSWCFVKLSPPRALWQLWWAAHHLWVSSLPPSWRWSMPHRRHPSLPMSEVSKMFLYSQVSDNVMEMEVRVGSKLLQMPAICFRHSPRWHSLHPPVDYGLFLVPGGMVWTIILLQLAWFSLGPLVRLCGVLHDPTRGWGGLRGQSAQYCLTWGVKICNRWFNTFWHWLFFWRS